MVGTLIAFIEMSCQLHFSYVDLVEVKYAFSKHALCLFSTNSSCLDGISELLQMSMVLDHFCFAFLQQVVAIMAPLFIPLPLHLEFLKQSVLLVFDPPKSQKPLHDLSVA